MEDLGRMNWDLQQQYRRALVIFFFQAEDGIRDRTVTGVQTCALPISGLAVVPLAAEHATAVVAAHRGHTDLALTIALGSSTQIALFVAPLLVAVGVALDRPMNLVFTDRKSVV